MACHKVEHNEIHYAAYTFAHRHTYYSPPVYSGLPTSVNILSSRRTPLNLIMPLPVSQSDDVK